MSESQKISAYVEAISVEAHNESKPLGERIRLFTLMAQARAQEARALLIEMKHSHKGRVGQV